MASHLTHLLPSPKQRSPTSRLLTPTTHPIPLLSSPTARNYSYTHAAFVLVYYYFRSGALVADPLPTMIADLLPLAVLQSVFCAVCLPAAGTWASGAATITTPTTSSLSMTTSGKTSEPSGVGKGAKSAKGSGTATGSTRKKFGAPVSAKGTVGRGVSGEAMVGNGGSWKSRIMVYPSFYFLLFSIFPFSPTELKHETILTFFQPTILCLILTLALPPVPLTILALALGAPLYPTSLLPHTLVLAVHISLLGFLPIFYTHGVSSPAWRDVAAAWLPFDEAGVWGGTVGSLVGGWIGAVPIALDWDREWQKWPCTVLWGAVLGWAIGRVLTGLLRKGIGRRIDLSETEDKDADLDVDLPQPSTPADKNQDRKKE